MNLVVLPSVQGSFWALASANLRCWSGFALAPLSCVLKRVLIPLSLLRRVACACLLWPAKRYCLPEGPRARSLSCGPIVPGRALVLRSPVDSGFTLPHSVSPALSFGWLGRLFVPGLPVLALGARFVTLVTLAPLVAPLSLGAGAGSSSSIR
eukprot:4384041-Amphidinium_carterae.1